MHLVLKSSRAKGQWRLNNFANDIEQILRKFALKNHIQLLSVATAGNRLHLHIKVRSRLLFRSFNRAVSSAIMMKVTGYSRWKKTPTGFRVWDTQKLWPGNFRINQDIPHNFEKTMFQNQIHSCFPKHQTRNLLFRIGRVDII